MSTGSSNTSWTVPMLSPCQARREFVLSVQATLTHSIASRRRSSLLLGFSIKPLVMGPLCMYSLYLDICNWNPSSSVSKKKKKKKKKSVFYVLNWLKVNNQQVCYFDYLSFSQWLMSLGLFNQKWLHWERDVIVNLLFMVRRWISERICLITEEQTINLAMERERGRSGRGRGHWRRKRVFRCNVMNIFRLVVIIILYCR